MRVSLENITYGELVRDVYQPCIMTLSSSWIGVSKSCWDCLGILDRRDQELICKESRGRYSHRTIHDIYCHMIRMYMGY